jgi:hypothetical protein
MSFLLLEAVQLQRLVLLLPQIVIPEFISDDLKKDSTIWF